MGPANLFDVLSLLIATLNIALIPYQAETPQHKALIEKLKVENSKICFFDATKNTIFEVTSKFPIMSEYMYLLYCSLFYVLVRASANGANIAPVHDAINQIYCWTETHWLDASELLVKCTQDFSQHYHFLIVNLDIPAVSRRP